MKIVVTARNYDLRCVEYMKNEGFEVEVYDGCLDMNEDELYQCVKDADAVIVGIERYQRSLLERLPRLKVVSRRGIGFDSVDVEACQKLGITFTRAVGAVEAPVAEQVMAYILYFARRVDQQSTLLKAGYWLRRNQLGARGRTLGLIGFGGIGKEIAKRALSFDMRVIATSHHDIIGSHINGVEILSEDEVLKQSDFVSINIPLREDTYHYANAHFFERMKKGSYFINISRGKVADTQALVEALDRHHLAGCATDVFEYEPCIDSPLSKFGDQVILTPHSCPFTDYDEFQMNMTSAKNTVEALKKRILYNK